MKKTFLALVLSGAIIGCNSQTADSPSTTQSQTQVSESQNPKQLAQQVFQSYFEESMALSPVYATFVGMNEYNDKFNAPISEASLAQNLALEQKYLDNINAIDESQLSGQDLLSYQIFKRDRELAIKGYDFPSHLIPLNQMYGIHNMYATLGSGQSAQPFNTYLDYQNFISRTDGFAAYMDSVIVAMREGMEQGVVLPRPIVDKILPQLSVHVVKDAKDSVFYGPVTMLDDNSELTDEQKQQVTEQYRTMIMDVLVPTYDKFYQFIESEYLPKARESVGLSALPNGKAWYEYQIETNTTLPLTANELHDFGQQEVARILEEMNKVKAQVGFNGDLPAFFTFLQEDEQFYWDNEQDVIDAYMAVKDDINQRLPKLFEVFPKADYEVRAVEAFRAASSAGASYQSPAPDGSRPGIFYINTHNLKAQPKFILETLSIHEASPGHHFQITIQQEVKDLPMFRKFGGYTVFSEGWALYAESLGKELGLFTDPYQWYGRLSDEQLRAMRLVVDTGLHAFGWTREQAIDFMAKNSSLAMSDIEAEVERYIAIPGQALAYKTGQRAIRDMRNKAQQQLGDDFDVRKFHTQVLIDGALPMPILEEKIMAWVETQK
ncbi:DUF885 domain-containing protein [Thalassotalea mangrovi]|uniref:DUF885 domain-containing protein n=1 Tax=Thalassotalea mangrovi TaxID=2572245 RepID=A0A4U1BAK9_9GAMM|nr:DUF885 domain-containing protein [Thalassotalea mangrovi]TKB47726.1 DUF885 domain-containing protein [Thalassotalea mangrovi]